MRMVEPVALQLHLSPRDVEATRSAAGWAMVEACVKNASWNCASTLWKSTSLTSIIEPCRNADIDLCVELVW